MPTYPELGPRDERNNWPSIDRPDGGPPPGWSHALAAGIDRPRSHVLSPDGSRIAFFWERDDCADLYIMPASGGWPARLTFGREPLPYWFDEAPRWSPDGEWLAYTSQEHAWVVAAHGGLYTRFDNNSRSHGTATAPANRCTGRLIDTDEVEPCRFFLEEWPGFARRGALRHYLHTAVEHEGSFERNKINDLAAEIEWHYNRVGATLPSFFQDTFAHDPASFNPMRMLTSSVAHADW